MKRSLTITILTFFVAMTAHSAALGSWRNFMAYHEVEQVEKAGGDIFVLASGGLYMYTPADDAIITFDKVSGLSDTHIDHIAWNKAVGRLIAVYDNSNIDLISKNGNIINVADLYSKVMTEDKTVNDVFVNGRYAYLATGFGAVKIDMSSAEVSESYILGFNVKYVYVENEKVFLSSLSHGLYSAPLTANMQDRNVWRQVGGFVDRAKTIDPALLAEVKALHPGGPKYGNFYDLKFVNGKLYSVGGLYSAVNEMNYPGSVQVLDNDKWTIYQDCLDSITGYSYADINAVAVDPANDNHVFAGGRTGLYEFEDGRLKNFFNKDNSPLDDAKNYGNTYVIVNGLCFDSEGNLWVLNSKSDVSNILKYKKDGTWESFFHEELIVNGRPMDQLRSLIIDSRGLLWFVNNDWRNAAVVCYDPKTNQTGIYDRFVNQDGANVGVVYVRCVAEDKEGNIWCGTNAGPLYITPSAIATSGNGSIMGNSNVFFTQFKVPRNDGSNYADYLLSNVDIQSITVDGANRKWFGTLSGVYLISADNMTQYHQFTKSNSMLLSDIINSVAIDGRTGEVFVATDKGLCSYMGDATTPNAEMTGNSVYAYPNPVEPSYTGLITVVGLSFDADVKVTTATGYLVAAGRSNGGTFTWDGCDLKGRRVASGVYNIITATSKGDKGTVCKVAIVR